MKTIMTILLILVLAVSPRLTKPKTTVVDTVTSTVEMTPWSGMTPAYVAETKTQPIAVCSNSSAKTYMDWTMTSATSKQGKFMRQHMTIRNGLLYDKDGYIGVALGSYFGTIGERYIFTLDTGIVLKLIKVEEKSDWHTKGGCEQKWDHSVIEFLVDIPTNKFPYFSNPYIANGNFNNLDEFKGNIKSIVKVLN